MAIVLAIASFVGLTSSTAFAAPAAPTPSIATPYVGQSFQLVGDIGDFALARSVEVQKFESSKWTKVSSGKTLVDGTYTLTASTTAPSRTFRVVAASVKKSSSHPALSSVTSDSVTVTTLPNSVSLTIARIGDNFRADGVATAALPGRLYTLQVKSGKNWVTVSDTTTANPVEAGSGGALSWTAPTAGSKSYRISGAAVDPAPAAVTSPTIAFNPGPAHLGKNVIYATTNSGTTPTKKGVDYTGNATLVSGTTVTGPLALETIAVRGNSTATKVKKPYKLKFIDKQKPFGLKSDKTWILLANYGDRTLVRSKVAWNVGAQLDGLKWTPASVFTELFINGKYLGSYQLVQSIKIDKNRVDVNKETGQVIEFDPHWKDGDGTFGFTGHSGMDFSFKDPDTYDTLDDGVTPDPEGLSDAKRAALKTRAGTFEHVLYDNPGTTDKKRDWSNTKADTYAPGDPNDWTTYLDMDSAVDYYLAREFTKDNDADFYRSNFFYTSNVFQNDPSQSDFTKFFMGPIWDFDRSAGAATGASTSIASPTGWWVRGTGSKNHNTNTIHWFTRIAKDPRFLNALHDRWLGQGAYTSDGPMAPMFADVSATAVDRAVASMGGVDLANGVTPTDVDEALGFTVAGNDRTLWASGGSRYGTHSSTFTGEISYLKGWYHDRYVWMNTELNKTPPPLS
ncbi:MAG: CotH protein [Aeromicrobium sp.]|nr:CotH protein [Aeromicrobium sp.]